MIAKANRGELAAFALAIAAVVLVGAGRRVGAQTPPPDHFMHDVKVGSLEPNDGADVYIVQGLGGRRGGTTGEPRSGDRGSCGRGGAVPGAVRQA